MGFIDKIKAAFGRAEHHIVHPESDPLETQRMEETVRPFGVEINGQLAPTQPVKATDPEPEDFPKD